MLMKKWEQALPPVCLLTAEPKCLTYPLPFGVKCLEQFRLASAVCPWQCVHPDDWRQVLFAVLRPLREAAAPAQANPNLLGWNLLCPRCQGVRSNGGGLVCDGLAGLHLLSQCKLFQKSCYALSIVKKVFQSEFLPMKTCNVLGIVLLWCQSVCIPACLLDIPGYPAHEQVLSQLWLLG